MSENILADKRLSITLSSKVGQKVLNLKEKLGQKSAAKAIEIIADLYLAGKLVPGDGQALEMVELRAKEEALKPIAQYLALIFGRAGLQFEVVMIEAALGSAAGVTAATQAHFDLPMDLMLQLQQMNEAARQDSLANQKQLFEYLAEMTKTLKIIAISTEITRGLTQEVTS
jgi:hypothetical protein